MIKIKMILLIFTVAVSACGGSSDSKGNASKDINGRYSSDDCLINIYDDEIDYEAFAQYARAYQVSFTVEDDAVTMKLLNVNDIDGPFSSIIGYNLNGERSSGIGADGRLVDNISHLEMTDFNGKCTEGSPTQSRSAKYSRSESQEVPESVSFHIQHSEGAKYLELDGPDDYFKLNVFLADGVLYSHSNYMTAGILIDGNSASFLIVSHLGYSALSLQ